jgi:hypothetical protein
VTRAGLIASSILAVGLAAALVIYVTAVPAADPLEIGLTESKQYQRQVELYGGKANLLALEAMDLLRSLLHGRRLAATVACASAIVAAGYWLLADAPPEAR